jgi:hypothetical protein
VIESRRFLERSGTRIYVSVRIDLSIPTIFGLLFIPTRTSFP